MRIMTATRRFTDLVRTGTTVSLAGYDATVAVEYRRRRTARESSGTLFSNREGSEKLTNRRSI